MTNQLNRDGVTIINSDPAKQPEPSTAVEEFEIDDTVSEVVEEEPTIEEATSKEIASEDKPVIIRKPHSVTQEFDINAREMLEGESTVTLPSHFDKETRDVLQQMPNINLLDNEESREWAKNVSEGLELTTFGEAFVPTLEDEEADFRHRIEDSGVSLIGSSPSFKSAQNETLKGERAVIRLVTHLGIGTLFQTPLWHSGLWVTFKPPSDSEIIEINRLLVSDKIRFGRSSYGLMFSNTLSYTTDRLVDFALAHVYTTTAKGEDISIANLKQHISCHDIPSLLWGFICTMYPRGFRYKRACVSSPDKCNYVLEETLNVSKLQWTNTAALTEWQKTFMAGKQAKTKDLASITRYKEELVKLKNKKIVINAGKSNEIAIILKSPNITEYIEAGYRWVSDIVDIVDRTLGLNTNDDERNSFITRYGQASAMRQYAHWIDSIEYDTNIINDSETLESNLDMLSTDDTVRSEFLKGVVDYINESTISVIGLPVYDCPKCKADQSVEHHLPMHKNIIPLDVIQLFFVLLGDRMSRLTIR